MTIRHDHHGPQGEVVESHKHRLGNVTHLHDQDGRPIFPSEEEQRAARVEGLADNEGPGKDQFGTVPDVGYFEAPKPPARVEDVTTELQPVPEPGPAPGQSIGDVAANDALDTVLFDDTDPALKHERIWVRLAVATLVRGAAEYHRYGKTIDAGLLMAARDQLEQVLANRGLPGNGGGS